ncbi:MAG: SH3 domain-containing protein [Labilithrix sp.]|nr:SH3 domain-containing protein [Labilithrix sp.]
MRLLSRSFALALSAVPFLACAATTDAEDDAVEESGDAITEAVPVGTSLRANANVKMRSAASTTASVLRTLRSGEIVVAVVSAPTDGFYRVRSGSLEGWVFGRYLDRSDGAASGGYANQRNIKLVYQGSCDFLHRCDSYSRRLPPGQVNWGCLGRGDVCIDSEHWASGPNRSYCGKTVKFCTPAGVCTTAVIKDVSVSRDFEASQGVFDALEIGYGGGSTCSNTFVNGNPRVTVHY